MPERLLVDLRADGYAEVLGWPGNGLPEPVSRLPFAWPLDENDQGDLRWYLEDYLRSPFGVWEDRGTAVRAKLAGWGERVFESVFGSGPTRFAYEQARDRGLEVVFRSPVSGLLGLPWELMRDSAGPVALAAGGVSRALPVKDLAKTAAIPGGRLRVLMVISRPAGSRDVGFRMVARPLLERLDAVRGEVDLVVLRPPTLQALEATLAEANEAGESFQVVHFDGHGVLPGRQGVRGGPIMLPGQAAEGLLFFERPGGGSDPVAASKVALVLRSARVPVVILNACQSGAMGADAGAAVATRLLQDGAAAVVAMAYSVYAVAAAEFMATFYERLFAGDTVSAAVTAGRRRLFEHDQRPSPKGDMPLADWLIPVHYLRREVSFARARPARPATRPPLDAALDRIRETPPEPADANDPLAPAGGVFVGRDDLFYQLESAARLQRVVVLFGPGGTGKTELAKGFARWWRDTKGVDDSRLAYWHSFEPGSASFGLDGVITGLGIETIGTDFALLDPPRRLEAVKQVLAQHRGLLVWDNFETVREMPDPEGATPPLDEAGCATLKSFLEWVADHSTSTVIITSRAEENWLGRVRRIEVGGLDRVEAAQYADHLLAPYPAARSRRELRSFGELLEWLDGHPMAMRLTLPRLDAAHPGHLLAELQGIIPLEIPSENAEPGRLSSLKACITYSFTHLTEATRQLLPAVSLFRGVADEDVLAAFSIEEGVPERFAGVSQRRWASMLTDAARVGLLTGLGEGMYQIHPALPAYLAAGWRGDNPSGYTNEREVAEQALCTACAKFSRWLTGHVESGDAALAYEVIGLQRRTLGAMLARALDRHVWDDAEGIVRALDNYWETRGLAGEADAWADRILAATFGPGQPPTLPARSLWLYTTIRKANRQEAAGWTDHAFATYHYALDFLQSQPQTEGTRSDVAVASAALGLTAQERGRLDEADGWYRKSLAIFEELGDRPRIAASYHQLGNIAQDRGRLDEADDWHRKSLAIFEELGDRPHMAVSHRQLGVTAYFRGRLDEADDRYRRSLALTADLGDRLEMAHTYHHLGITAQLRGRLDAADDWYRKSLTIKEKLGNRPDIAGSYHQLGTTAQERERLDEADAWYRKSLAIFEELGDRPRMAACYHYLGTTAQQRGQLDQADAWYRKSLAIKEELGDRPALASTYGQLGLLAETRRQPIQALAWTVRCVGLFDEFPHPLTGPAPQHLARLARQLGIRAVKRTWRQVTGRPLPPAIRGYITSHGYDNPPGDQP